MKATLTFNLEEPEDAIAHLRCIKALDLTLTLIDIRERLRAWEKYPPETFTPESVRTELLELINERVIIEELAY